ncbi:MAG: tryptophan--tRNA ligase [Saprospiraceae bacterium]|nr:tryptophan--tRNA ligase [Saprospiraceae bacterium]
MSARKTVLSAIQPTGNMHLGNYFGAVKNWVDLQEKYTCYYGVVDYHAMTMPYDVQKLRTNTWDLITNLVAVGVNPENLFIQYIAQRFNFQAGKEYFVLPDALYTETPKIRSTADPSKKMSKSAGEKHYINVFADEETIRRQIKSAVTDSGDTPAGKMAEGVENLFELIKATGNKTDYDRLLEDFHAGTLKYVDLKQVTADNLVAMTSGFIEKKKEISSDKRKLKDQVKQSSFEIRKRAQETVREVKELIGLMNV